MPRRSRSLAALDVDPGKPPPSVIERAYQLARSVKFSDVEKMGALRRKAHRAVVRLRLMARRVARSRSVSAATLLGQAAVQFGRAVMADVGPLAAGVQKRLASMVDSVEWGEAKARLQAIKPRLFWRPRPLRLTLAFVLLLVVTGMGVVVWALNGLPYSKMLTDAAPPNILLEASNGDLLVRRGPFKGPDKTLQDFPSQLIDAVLSVEDRNFYSHPGIDIGGVLRALGRNIMAGRVVEGGSTITQQLVKFRYLDPERTFKRKFREAALAMWLEWHLTKDEILTRYLNTVYLGAGATGMPAGARIYFDKDVADLTLAESALLAGLIRSPSQLNPLNELKLAQERAEVVLDAMVANGKLDRKAADEAKIHPAALSPARLNSPSGTWFADWVYGEAAEIAGPFLGTMQVKTTLIPEFQALAERVVSDVLAEQGQAVHASQAALVAMLPSGAVAAMVGGRSYGDSQFNRAAQASRQPGSAFKLFVYFAALRAGFSPADQIQDSPLDVDGWKPENFDSRYHGRVSLAEAFARSLNTATVRLALKIGLDKVIAAARDLGIEAPLANTPSLALGTSEVSLLELTGAYAAVRAGVAPVKPWGIASFGAEEQPHLFRLGARVEPRHEIGPYQNDLIGLLRLVVERGTGRKAALDGFAAGKTGTSQNYRDAWFVGFTEQLIAGVWVGNDDGSSMDKVTGGELPALIWRKFMEGAVRLGTPEKSLVSEDPSDEGSSAEASEVACNYQACARAYRSFRASDCTYQPYSGSRELCDK